MPQQNSVMKFRNGSEGLLSSVLLLAFVQGACGTATLEPPKLAGPPRAAEEAPDENWETGNEAPVKNEDAPVEDANSSRSSRPALKLRHDSSIEASVDSTGADLQLGGNASLVFPVESLQRPVPYNFAQRKVAAGPKRIGLSYMFSPAVNSAGDPFVLELPLPSWAKTANFAILHTGPRKPGQSAGWRVVAGTRIDHDKGIAILETADLPEGYIYLTSKSAN